MILPLIGPALTKIGMGSQLAGLVNLVGAAGAASTIPFVFGAGQPSEEEQERMLRRQLEIQDEFEQQRTARAGGGMGELEGLVGGGSRMGVPELTAIEELTRKYGATQNQIDRLMQRRVNPELEALLAGNTARIAQMQSQRALTPFELIQIAEST
jgi:hypothetical protein